jgi:hypothetical protein
LFVFHSYNWTASEEDIGGACEMNGRDNKFTEIFILKIKLKNQLKSI